MTESKYDACSLNAVLFVDDDPLMLNMLRRGFSRLYYIETASSGKEGLETIDELLSKGIELKVVVSDYEMPGGMFGDKFLEEVGKKYPLIGRIMHSGNPPKYPKEDIGYVTLIKPVEKEEMTRRIDELILQYNSKK